jgi:hypothetical protein
MPVIDGKNPVNRFGPVFAQKIAPTRSRLGLSSRPRINVPLTARAMEFASDMRTIPVPRVKTGKPTRLTRYFSFLHHQQMWHNYR